MRAHSKPAVVDVDIARVHEILEQVRTLLPDEVHECLARLVESYVEMMRLVRERGTTIARLRHLFGLRQSEKIADVLGNTQATPPPDAGAASADAHADTNATTNGTPDPCNAGDGHDVGDKARSRKGHGRRGAEQYSDAACVAVAHQSLHAGDVCPGCEHGKLHYLPTPACLVRIVGQAPLAANVWQCERLRCGGCGKVFTARAPQEAYGPKYDASAVAMMALLRYRAGVPLHRLGRLQENLATPVPASTQWQVVRDHLEAVEPAHGELCRLAAQGRVLHNDDTSMRILALAGKRRAKLLEADALPDPDRTGTFTTGIVSVTDAGPIALFFSGRQHAGENLGALLDQRAPGLPPPIHMCDGLDRNVPPGHDVVRSNCLAHGRRHVVDEAENFPAECRHVLQELGKVFDNDATCREQKLTAQERLAFHQRESDPVLRELETWISAALDEHRIEPNSGLGEAFRYLLKRWDKLTLFLRIPGAPLDNNLCERVLKMAIRHRNNSLFYRSDQGAHVGDVFMALIYTAELHDENPFAYLVALLRHAGEVAEAPTDWLPWTFRATLARRAAA